MFANSEIALPASLDAEKAILSVLFQQPERITGALGDDLSRDHFHFPQTRIVWEELCMMHREGLEIELISLVERLRHAGNLENTGGPAEVTEIYSFVPTAQYWSQHVGILRDRLARRKMIKFAADVEDATMEGQSPEHLAARAKEAADAIMDVITPETEAKTAEQACKEFNDIFIDLAQSDALPGLPTGLERLDVITGGMRSGELWVVSGPTSSGKSVLCLQAANESIKLGKKAGVFSLEMGAEENVARLISCGYGVDYGRLRNPRAGQPMIKSEIQSIKRALESLGQSNLTIWDKGGMTIEKIESLAIQWKDIHGLDLLIVDYIQLVRSSVSSEGRERELAYISGNLKQLAKKLHCPVMTGSQLNDDGKLKAARAIGEDADVVLRIEGAEGIYVIKNRNGEKHVHIPYQLNGPRQKFTYNKHAQSPE